MKKIIKIKGEINEIEKIKQQRKITETISQFFEKINKIDKPLAKWTKEKRENIQIIRIRNESGGTTSVLQKKNGM